MTWYKVKTCNVELCNTVPRLLPAYKVPGTYWDYVAICVLSCCFHIHKMVNLFVFLGNWDILTLLVMADIVFFMVVTVCRLNVMYGVIFLLVMDLVICIYVMYL